MMSDVRYEIKLRYLLSDFEILTLKKSGSVRLNEQRTTDPGSWLIWYMMKIEELRAHELGLVSNF
jgi:hypothetical protein